MFYCAPIACVFISTVLSYFSKICRSSNFKLHLIILDISTKKSVSECNIHLPYTSTVQVYVLLEENRAYYDEYVVGKDVYRSKGVRSLDLRSRT